MKKEIIERIYLNSGNATTIEFANIPSSYDTLYLKLSSRGTYSGGGQSVIYCRFNNDATTSYYYSWLGGNATTVTRPVWQTSNSRLWLSNLVNDSWTAGAYGTTDITISQYDASQPYVGVMSLHGAEQNGTGGYISANAGHWYGGAKINRITLTCELNDFKQYSSAELYGVVHGSDGTTTVS